MDFSNEWKGQNRALIGCPSVSGENVNACLLPKLYWQSLLYHANVHAHREAILFSWLPALSRTQISVEALIQTFCSVMDFLLPKDF